MSVEQSSPPQPSRSVSGFLVSTWRAISVPVAAVLLAALIGAIILLISGAPPLPAYAALIKGSFGSPEAIARTLEKATPLVFSGPIVFFSRIEFSR